METCSECGAAPELLAHVRRTVLCAACWHRLGEPFPWVSTVNETAQAEIETHERMLKRGGTSRHLVRKGIA